MCIKCSHKAVCSIYRATGGVKRCEHQKEERRGRWITWQEYFPKSIFKRPKNGFCSYCGAFRVKDKFCPNCGADMGGDYKNG